MIEINGIPIIDYVERINHDNCSKCTKEDLDEIMDNFSELREKFGIVFDISSYRTNNSTNEEN